jgi:uncharacterized membrane protein
VTAWLWALGRMLGLGDMAGMRPSLTLAVIGVASKFDLGPGVSAPFFWMDHWFTILIFVILAIFEASFDKVPRWGRMQGRLTLPYRLVAGGVAGASVIHLGWPGFLAGAAVGAGMAWVSQHTKGRTRPRSAPSEAALNLMSLYEDLAALLGTVATLAFAPVGYVIAGVEGAVLYGARYRRRAKYRKMGRGGSGG